MTEKLPKVFPWFPMTIERAGTPVPVSVAYGAQYWDDAEDAGAAGFATVDWEEDYREFDVEEVITNAPQEFRFKTPSGLMVVLRPSIPEDAASGQFNVSYPLPTEILGAIMTHAIPDNTTLSAAADDDGDVHTMILETGLGLYARYSQTWLRLIDTAPIENLNIVDVPGDDLAAYDEADTAGEMLNLTDLHPFEGQEAVEVIQPREEPEPVTSSAGPVNAIIIGSLDDVPRAVAFAATPAGEASRWYVARRARRLGYTTPFPWEQP